MRFFFAFLSVVVTGLWISVSVSVSAAEPEFPLTADSKPQDRVPKGTLIQDSHTAREGSVFPGTEREVTLYLPAGFDKTKPAAFMVFQDGVLYQAPVVFDNLIARGDIPPLVGVFIKPGVVPAPNENAQPRYNRSCEYDSVTDTYSTFLIDELLPALEEKHGLTFSTDPNDTAIAGNSSGGICAFMAAWHRPDRFRRVFSGVGTYVGIRGADRLPVLIRKFEPKPLRVFLQSGSGDNNLYCGDWWMANQMMERSLTWAGYDVNHAWGEGGHNQKHASQIFPDVLRWLWRDWKTDREVKANPRGESQWKGYEVVDGDEEWTQVYEVPPTPSDQMFSEEAEGADLFKCKSDVNGVVYAYGFAARWMIRIGETITKRRFEDFIGSLAAIGSSKTLRFWHEDEGEPLIQIAPEQADSFLFAPGYSSVAVTHDFRVILTYGNSLHVCRLKEGRANCYVYLRTPGRLSWLPDDAAVCLSPDQSQLYLAGSLGTQVSAVSLINGELQNGQLFCDLEAPASGLCVDSSGLLYAATFYGVEVCDQLGRVNFIIPTPKPAYDVCFGGKDLSELFIACGDSIYKRPTKVHGIVSGQMPPVKPPKPKL